jgi:antitoxin VapB
MATKTTVFQSGNSQAVRIPKAFQFSSKQVRISREGRRIVLEEEPESLAGAFDALRELDWPQDAADLMKDRRPPQARDWSGLQEVEPANVQARGKGSGTRKSPRK